MTNANKKALHAKLVAIINELPIADFVALHDTFCNNEEYGGNPNAYIYEMNRFNEMHKNMTPEEIVVCTCNSNFDVTDGYWFENEEGGEYSASTKDELINRGAWIELNTVYADFIIESGKDCGIKVIADVLKEKPDFTDWKNVKTNLDVLIHYELSEILLKNQVKLGILDGKIDPIDDYTIDELVDKLADLMTKVLKYEKGEM